MSKVFLVHGWTYSLDKYEELIKLLRSRGIDLEVLHVPGLSEPSKKVWDIDDYSDWLEDKIGKDNKPILIGHSNGGRIILKYLNKHPNSISKLILIDSAGVYDNSKAKSLKLKTYKTVAKIGKFTTSIPYAKKAYYRLIGASDYYHARPNMKKTMQNMLNADKELDINNIDIPTTIIWGREDKLTPLRDGQILNKAIKGSKLDIIDKARHSPHASHPHEVANIIYEFIKS